MQSGLKAYEQLGKLFNLDCYKRITQQKAEEITLRCLNVAFEHADKNLVSQIVACYKVIKTRPWFVPGV